MIKDIGIRLKRISVITLKLTSVTAYARSVQKTCIQNFTRVIRSQDNCYISIIVKHGVEGTSEILSHDIFKKMLQCFKKDSSNHEIGVLKGRYLKSFVIYKWS